MAIQSSFASIHQKEKKKGVGRFLVTVTVSWSCGPIRVLVNEEELVGSVIRKVAKKYAQEGRLPLLGSDLSRLNLRSVNSGYDALNPMEPIGSCGSRSFILCKEEKQDHTKGVALEMGRKGIGSWKALVIKSFGFRIPSH